MSFRTAAAKVFIIFSVPFLLTLLGVRMVMTPLFLHLEYHRAGFPEDSYGFTRQDRLAYGPYAVNYLLNGEDIAYLGDLRLPLSKCIGAPAGEGQDCAMFNINELRHMHDVKVVTTYAYISAFSVGIGASIAAGLLWRSAQARQHLRTALRNGAVLTLTLIASIIIAALVSWDFFFTSFHTLLFESGTWRFAYSDTLIRLFPEQFWFDAAITIGALAAIGAALLLLLSRPSNKLWRNDF